MKKLLILIFLFSYNITNSQIIDNYKDSLLRVLKNRTYTKEDKKKIRNFVTKPIIAGVLSAIVPGAGQFYLASLPSENKKRFREYIRTPIIWAVIGTFLYFELDANRIYSDYYTAYIIRNDNNPFTVDIYDERVKDTKTPSYGNEKLLSNVNEYRRTRDILFSFVALLYVANIIDAVVQYHLRSDKFNEKLSLQISPSILPLPLNENGYLGLNLKLKFGLKNNEKKIKKYY